MTKNKKESKNKEQSVEPKENDEQLQEKRKEAYLERSSQILLRSLIKNGNNSEIIPTYEPNFGYIYKTAEKAFTQRCPRFSRTSNSTGHP